VIEIIGFPCSNRVRLSNDTSILLPGIKKRHALAGHHERSKTGLMSGQIAGQKMRIDRGQTIKLIIVCVSAAFLWGGLKSLPLCKMPVIIATPGFIFKKTSRKSEFYLKVLSPCYVLTILAAN